MLMSMMERAPGMSGNNHQISAGWPNLPSVVRGGVRDKLDLAPGVSAREERLRAGCPCLEPGSTGEADWPATTCGVIDRLDLAPTMLGTWGRERAGWPSRLADPGCRRDPAMGILGIERWRRTVVWSSALLGSGEITPLL